MIKERRAPSTREPGSRSPPSKVTSCTLGKAVPLTPPAYQPLNSRSCLCWSNITQLLPVKEFSWSFMKPFASLCNTTFPRIRLIDGHLQSAGRGGVQTVYSQLHWSLISVTNRSQDNFIKMSLGRWGQMSSYSVAQNRTGLTVCLHFTCKIKKRKWDNPNLLHINPLEQGGVGGCLNEM